MMFGMLGPECVRRWPLRDLAFGVFARALILTLRGLPGLRGSVFVVLGLGNFGFGLVELSLLFEESKIGGRLAKAAAKDWNFSAIDESASSPSPFSFGELFGGKRDPSELRGEFFSEVAGLWLC